MMRSRVLKHYGTKRRSGRYPWGSGGDILKASEELAAQGFSELEIAKSLGISTTDLRQQKALIKLEQKEALRLQIIRMKESGMRNQAVADELGMNESSVRAILSEHDSQKYQLIKKVADILVATIAKFGLVDIGDGVEQYLGVTSTKLKNAISLLEKDGYQVQYLREPQLGTGKKTSYKVLTPPGMDYNTVKANKLNIAIPMASSSDNGFTFDESMPIENVSMNRVLVVKDPRKDGFVELRPGVKDLSIGSKRYAQVRIGVDGTHYIKGMAAYSDVNLPKGKDIIFYTSKDLSDNPLNNLKEQDLSAPNPFGATVRQKFYIDENGQKKPSVVNVVNEEGDWSNWARKLSSQFLSKQSPELASEQLKLSSDIRTEELNSILSLTNEVVKRHLLLQYADGVDSDAVKLKAAPLPRQSNNVIIPILSISPNEVYAPNYKDGEVVVLIRHPHGGKFEIPTLVVNNKNAEAKRLLGSDPLDAIGIHPDVAAILSGADFDGDTVTVALKNNKISTSRTLDSLKNFNPREAYPYIPGLKLMSEPGKQREMGIISNLITDMTIRGASSEEIARAVKHSMVVIDAAKHKLNYRQSYLDNGIAALKLKYQSDGDQKSGASTVISRAKSVQYVPQRSDRYEIDPATGRKIFIYTNQTKVNKNGEQIPSLTKSSRMYEVDDASVLSSGTRIERVYANHANTLKNLGNLARKAYLETTPQPYSPQAKKAYQEQVDSLNSKLRIATMNRPLERKAQILANSIYSAKLKSNPGMSTSDKATARGRALVVARLRIGAKKELVDITPLEWEAIQMGAITATKLEDILRNSDVDQIKAYATPRTVSAPPKSKVDRALSLLKMGYTPSEVAMATGIPVSTINSIKKGDQ